MERAILQNRFYPGLVSDVAGTSVEQCKDMILGYLACLSMEGLGLEALDRLQTLSPQVGEAINALAQENKISTLRLGGVERVGFCRRRVFVSHAGICR